MYRRFNVGFLFLICFTLLATAGNVSAQQINVSFGEPDFDVGGSSVPTFIHDLYLFAIGIAGVLAVGAIVIGGIMYSISGAVDKKNSAKEIIVGALWGLLLLLGSYIILRTVNPELVTLQLSELAKTGVLRCGDMEDLPWCEPGQPEINFDTGECQCRNKPADGCPLTVKKKIYSQKDAPEYLWLKEYERIPDAKTLFETDEIPDISENPGECPNFVKIPANTTPYFITSVDKDEGSFVLDLSKQPKFTNLAFPLPDGEYYGEVVSYYISGKLNQALCLVNEIHDFKNNLTFIIFNSGLKNASICGNYSDVENEVKLRIKKSENSGSQNCSIGKTYCAPNNLESKCPQIAKDNMGEKWSRTCTGESNEIVDIVSGSDFCPGAKKYGFSMGLFQINVIANGKVVTEVARKMGKQNPDSCEGLYSGESKLKKGQYQCKFLGDVNKWTNCLRLLSDPNLNIEVACNIYKSQGLKAWGAARRCGLL